MTFARPSTRAVAATLIAAAIGLLTVALPVGLVVIGLVFGQRSERRLAQFTHAVLDTLIPAQVQQLACAPRGLQFTQLSRTGCRSTYRLSAPGGQAGLRSEPGRGSTFFIELPLAAA